MSAYTIPTANKAIDGIESRLSESSKIDVSWAELGPGDVVIEFSFEMGNGSHVCITVEHPSLLEECFQTVLGYAGETERGES